MKLHEPIDVGGKSINTIIHDRESLVHLLPETAKFESDEPFKRRKALIDGSSFLCRFFLGHLPYLAALTPDESQVLKLHTHLIRPHSDFRFIFDFGLLRISDYNLHFAICHLHSGGSAAPVIRQIFAEPLIPCIVDFANRAQLRVSAVDAFDQRHDPKINSGQVRIGAEVIADHYDAFVFELGEHSLDFFPDKLISFQRCEHFRGEPRFFPTAAQQIHDRLSSLGYVTGSAHSLFVHVAICS